MLIRTRPLWAVAVVAVAGVALAGAAGPGPAGADEVQPSTVEDYAYPGAERVLAERGVRLVSGDGHIALADCGPNPDAPPADLILVQTLDFDLPGDPNFCFRATGAVGHLALEISKVYLIRGESDRTVFAKVETLDDPAVVDVEQVDPREWQPVGIGQSRGDATVLELRFPTAP